MDDFPINFDLGLNDFIDKLVASPNFKYNYRKMWIREILLQWASDIALCESFDKKTSQNILPKWINYVIQKIRDSQADSISQFCEYMLLDIKYFYEFHDGDESHCFRNENIVKVIQTVHFQVDSVSVAESQVVEEYMSDEGIDNAYELFSEQFHFLVSLIKNTLSTHFKYQLFEMAFSKPSTEELKSIQAPYILQMPKKYLAASTSDALQVAKVSLNSGMERLHQFTMGEDTSDEEEQKRRSSNEGPISSIIPLSQALNVDSAIWDSKKGEEE